MIPAIPTQYRGHLFRSRLEARWAAFFDSMGWRWTYEPLDLEGYIPDFMLHFPSPLLVEVKPAATLDEMAAHTARIEATSWKGEFLIVGATPVMDNSNWSGEAIGLLAERSDEGGWLWDAAQWMTCEAADAGRTCGCRSFFHSTQTYTSRVCGHADGARHIGPTPDALHAAWGQAHQRSRWNPGGAR